MPCPAVSAGPELWTLNNPVAGSRTFCCRARRNDVAHQQLPACSLHQPVLWQQLPVCCVKLAVYIACYGQQRHASCFCIQLQHLCAATAHNAGATAEGTMPRWRVC